MIKCRDYRSIFPLTLAEMRRLLANIRQSPDECWLWTGYVDGDGYGRICIRGAYWHVHRMIYELMLGPVPLDCILHHRCKNKRCCNPLHLKPATRSLHIELDDVHRKCRSPQPPQEFCRRGHELTDESTRWRTVKGKRRRVCLACEAAANVRRNRTRRLKRAAAVALRASADARSQLRPEG